MKLPKNKIFRNEIDFLESCKEKLNSHKPGDNELWAKFNEMVLQYEKLLRETQKIYKISDVQGRALKKKENDIKNLLDHANQGFLTFGPDLLVDKEYSWECTRIFGGKINNENIVDILAGEDSQLKERLRQILKGIFETDDQNLVEDLLKQIPHIININGNYIEVKAQFINHVTDEEDLGLLILTDVTTKYKSMEEIEQLSYLSYSDRLTGLYNRAYIEKSVAQILSLASNLPLSIILADMNNLKMINDVYGHQKGDELIINTARMLQQCCRRTDIVARWGGDEFLILLPNTDEYRCQKVVGRIKDLCFGTNTEGLSFNVAIGSATMLRAGMDFSELFLEADKKMYKHKFLTGKRMRKKIIADLETILQSRGYELTGHIGRVKKMSERFAEVLAIRPNSKEMDDLLLLASLHDVGKVAIPLEILNKTTDLNPEEWEMIKDHSEVGYRMAQSIGRPVVAEMILAMHERFDGTGYPYGIKGNQIPRLSKLLAIVDAFDVMIHDRPYRKGISEAAALKEIAQQSGAQFDPELVKVFLENFERIVER